MKRVALFIFLLVGMGIQLYSQNLPVINKTKKTFNLYMDNGDDTPLIYGYETASASGKKIICFSTFTVDVENNPHKCLLGAYYHTEDIEIQYLGTEGAFVKLQFIDSNKGNTVFYIETKNVKFE